MTNEREPSDAAYKAMCQAHSLCPIDLPYLGRMRWMAARVEAALASQAQPVAWRYRYSKEGSWRFANESASKWAPNDRFEEEPLYAAPVAAGEPHTDGVKAPATLSGRPASEADECHAANLCVDAAVLFLNGDCAWPDGAMVLRDQFRAIWREHARGVALPRADQQENGNG